jgi:uncharacterized protein YoxC
MIGIYQKNIEQLTQKSTQLQNLINKKKDTIQSIAQKKGTKSQITKLSQTECDRIEELYRSKRRELNKMIEEIYQLEETVQKMQIEKEEI